VLYPTRYLGIYTSVHKFRYGVEASPLVNDR
jgi:hypothetical protein